MELKRVEYMPRILEPNILYFAEGFRAAAHLCACGCGSKIRTPIGDAEWNLIDGTDGVSLLPSIGNWQQPCRSHYFITNGEIVWMGQWSDERIRKARAEEEEIRRIHYSDAKLNPRKVNPLLAFTKYFRR